MKNEGEKSEVYIRSDGWVFTEDGMKRLKEGGHKGFARFKESMESQLGEWHRVSKPLDKDAAAALKQVKGLVARGVFLSTAIVKEAERRARGRSCGAYRRREAADAPAEFMRLTLTEDAYSATCGLKNAEFRDLVSSAILAAARRRQDIRTE